MLHTKSPVSPEEMKSANSSLFKTLSPRTVGFLLWLMLGILFVILIGLYIWYQTLSTSDTVITSTRPTAEMNQEPESRRAVADTDALQALSTSDELTTIIADLESTRLDTLLTEIDIIEAELDTINN